MHDLATQLRQRLVGRVGLVGLGSEDHGDDACGVRLAQRLAARRYPHLTIAGTAAERGLRLADAAACDHLVFLDAVECGGAPGAVVFLDRHEMAARFPSVSTHKLALGLLAQLVEEPGRTRAWLLGVQPASLRPSPRLSPAVEATVGLLEELLWAVLGGAAAGSPCAPAKEGTAP